METGEKKMRVTQGLGGGRGLLAVLAATLGLAGPVPALGAELAIGQPAPAFALADETGKLQRLADYRGRTVVLMFYPKDFTPG